MSLANIKTVRGLYTSYNAYSEVPDGALIEADNISISKPGYISPRRGLGRYGLALNAASYFEFKDRLLSHNGTTISYDSTGTGIWATHSGYSAPDSSTRMLGIEADLSLILNTSKGAYVMDQLTVAPVRAGMPGGLDVQLSLTGTGLGWLLDGQVAYRVIFGRTDVYGRLKIGAPSMRVRIVNAAIAVTLARTGTLVTATTESGSHGFVTGDTVTFVSISQADLVPNSTITNTGAGTFTYTTAVSATASGQSGVVGRRQSVTLAFTVPKDVALGDFYGVYRTASTATGATAPDDRGRLVFRAAISSTDISNRDTAAGIPITVLDAFDPSFLGEDLYTNTTRQGIQNANSRAPWCKYMASWKGFMFYGYTRREHALELQLTDVTSLVDDTSSITFTIGATPVTYIFSTANNIAARKFKRETAQATGAENVRMTMENLALVINRDNVQSSFYAYYSSGINDPPGMLVVEARDPSIGQISVICNNSTTAGKFQPNLPTTGTTFASDNETVVNGIYRSKQNEYESVPEGRLDELGDPARAVIALVPTRDSLIAVKEDGIWRLTGDTERTLVWKPLETTIHGRAPYSWASFDNAAWGLSTKGIVRVTEAGTDLMSYTIDDKIQSLLMFPNFETFVHAIPYESEGTYLLCAPELSTDTKPTIIYVYDSEAKNGPTIWRKPVKCGLVLKRKSRLYLQHYDDGYALQDRKSFTADGDDYRDEELPGTITAVGTTTFEGETRTQVTMTFTPAVPRVGWLFRKTPVSLPFSRVEVVAGTAPNTYVLTLGNYFPGLTPGDGSLSVSILSRIAWIPESGDSLGMMKQFRMVSIYFAESRISRARVGFRSDIVPVEDMTGTLVMDTEDGNAPLQVPVPTAFQHARALYLTMEHDTGGEGYELAEKTITFDPAGEVTTEVPA